MISSQVGATIMASQVPITEKLVYIYLILTISFMVEVDQLTGSYPSQNKKLLT